MIMHSITWLSDFYLFFPSTLIQSTIFFSSLFFFSFQNVASFSLPNKRAPFPDELLSACGDAVAFGIGAAASVEAPDKRQKKGIKEKGKNKYSSGIPRWQNPFGVRKQLLLIDTAMS